MIGEPDRNSMFGVPCSIFFRYSLKTLRSPCSVSSTGSFARTLLRALTAQDDVFVGGLGGGRKHVLRTPHCRILPVIVPLLHPTGA